MGPNDLAYRIGIQRQMEAFLLAVQHGGNLTVSPQLSRGAFSRFAPQFRRHFEFHDLPL
jgi:hypothetical protein